MLENKRLFIAGGTGLIGSACHSAGKTISGVEVFAPTRNEVDFFQEKQIVDYLLTHKITHGIFAAGFNGGIRLNIEQPAELILKNSLLAINAISSAHKAELQRMIVFGSSCVYPLNAEQPFNEGSIMTGSMEVSSLAYSTSKLLLIQMALSFNLQHPDKTLFIPLIPNTVYGPNDNFDPISSHVVAALIFKLHHARKSGSQNVVLWGSGSVKREFVFSDDVASASMQLLFSQKVNTTLPINVTSGEEVTIMKLAKLISRIVGYDGKITWDKTMPDGVSRKALNNQKLIDLGLQPETSLIDGVLSTYQWFLKSKWA